MALGAGTSEFNEVLNDQKVSLTYSVATRSIDPIYGQANSVSYADETKQWIFFKRSSELALKQWGIVEVGDAYVIMTASDSMRFGDRVTLNSETFEYTPDCKEVYRYVGSTALFKYYSLKLVA